MHTIATGSTPFCCYPTPLLTPSSPSFNPLHPYLTCFSSCGLVWQQMEKAATSCCSAAKMAAEGVFSMLPGAILRQWNSVLLPQGDLAGSPMLHRIGLPKYLYSPFFGVYNLANNIKPTRYNQCKLCRYDTDKLHEISRQLHSLPRMWWCSGLNHCC